MKIRYAKEKDTKTIKEIWKYCFNDTPVFMDYYFKHKYSRGNTVVVNEDDEIVSSLQLNQYKINLNNKVYDTSYVVGVSTFPEVRGRGYMKHIMEFTLEELYKKGQLVSILMPIDYRLYRRYGYEHCYDQLEYNIDINDLGKLKISGRMHKVNDSHIGSLIDIHNEFLKNVNGNVLRDEEYYKVLFEEIKSEGGHIYIHEDKGYEGYIIYFLNGENMFVRELYYKNMNSLKSMMKFIYNHNTQLKTVTITSPLDDKIRFTLENPKTTDVKIKPFMMGRIINLKGYLESLDVPKELNASINICIEDNFINENDGVFKIEIRDGKVLVNKVERKSDISFNINTFTQLAFSYIDIEEALFLNNICIDDIKQDVIDLLKSIFTKKVNYINEYV